MCRSRFRKSTTGFSKTCHVVSNAWDELPRPKPDHPHLYNNNRHYSSAISCDSCFHFFENDVDCLVQMSNKWKHVALLVSFWKESFIRVCFMFRIFLYNANHTNCINMFTKRLPLLLRVMRESKYCVYFQINLMPVAISLTLLTQIIYTLYFLCVLKLICKLLNECGKLTFFCCVKSML